MKKLLMIWATPFFSDRGCHIRILNEIKYLQKEWYDITLTTYHIWNDIRWMNIKRIVNIPWYQKTSPWASWHKIYLDFFLLILSIKHYFIIKPKIIHAHLYEGLLIAYIIKILSGFQVKIIFDCQWSLAWEMLHYNLSKKSYLKIFYHFFVMIEKILLKLPDYIFCSSENSYHILREKYKVWEEKIDILPDGIDSELFWEKTKELDIIKNTYGIHQDNIVILYTWWLSKAKWIDIFFEHIDTIIKNNSKITFLVAWYWDLENELKQKYKKYVQRGNVIFTWRFSYFDLPQLFSLSDYALEPKISTSESSGKLYNYIAWWLKVICFKTDFNYSVLWDQGIYISNFVDISKVVIKKIWKSSFPKNEILWENIIKKYLIIYEKYAQ